RDGKARVDAEGAPQLLLVAEFRQVGDIGVICLLCDAQLAPLPASHRRNVYYKLRRNLSPVRQRVNRRYLTWRPHLTSPDGGEGTMGPAGIPAGAACGPRPRRSGSGVRLAPRRCRTR